MEISPAKAMTMQTMLLTVRVFRSSTAAKMSPPQKRIACAQCISHCS